MFEGFTQETSDFIWELSFHNERPWFLEHRDVFERVLKKPFDDLSRDTAALLAERFPAHSFDLHIARIYRDARRLFGRGPYKDHLWFSLKESDGLLTGPMFWFEIGAAEYSYGMGFYSATARQMEVYRAAIDANPARAERLAKSIAEQDRFVLEGEDYSRPKGDRGELLNPWYNKKHLSFTFEDDFGGVLLSPELPRVLVDGYAFLMPIYEFLLESYEPDPRELREREQRK